MKHILSLLLDKIFFFFSNCFRKQSVITIYAPVNLTAPCILIFMRARPLRGGLGPGTRDICEGGALSRCTIVNIYFFHHFVQVYCLYIHCAMYVYTVEVKFK